MLVGIPRTTMALNFFVEVFKSFKTFNSQPIFYDGESDIYKLDIKVDGNVTFKGAMDEMLKSLDALNERGS